MPTMPAAAQAPKTVRLQIFGRSRKIDRSRRRRDLLCPPIHRAGLQQQYGFAEGCTEELGRPSPTQVEGQVGVTTATHHLGRLAIGPWGEEKTTTYVKALAQQNPVVGELGPTYTRLQLGEIVVALSLTDSYIYLAKQTGAPVAEADDVQPVVAPSYHVGVLKGAQHPNAAHLFAVFMTMPESQPARERGVR